MKQINFINPITAKHEQELRRWIVISLSIILSILAGIAIFTAVQLKVYYDIQRKCDTLAQDISLNTPIEEKNSASKKTHDALKQKVTKLHNKISRQEKTLSLLSAIKTAIGPHVLQSITLTKKSVEIKIMCFQAKHATSIITRLSQSDLVHNTELISLQTVGPNQLLATISATRVKK